MSTTTLNLIICGFILFLAAIAYSVTTFYRRAVQDTPEGYPRGRVAGKTREQRNNLIIMLVPWLVIILPGTYFLYQYFQYVPILCPLGLIVLGWLGMAGFIFRNYLTAATMDRRGVGISLHILEKYQSTGDGREYYLILQPPGSEVPRRYPVSQNAYNKLNAGDTLQVRYLPDKPEIIRVENDYVQPRT